MEAFKTSKYKKSSPIDLVMPVTAVIRNPLLFLFSFIRAIKLCRYDAENFGTTDRSLNFKSQVTVLLSLH